MPDTHAKYSISAMYRILGIEDLSELADDPPLGCTASIGAIAELPEGTASASSAAAERGTAGHWIVEEGLAGNFVSVGDVAPNGVEITDELMAAADMCLEAVIGRNFDDVYIEQKINVAAWLGVDLDCWGTADIVGVKYRRGGAKLASIEVMDHKFGHMEVAASAPQPGLYAGGARNTISNKGVVDSRTKIRTTILQPASQTFDKTFEPTNKQIQALSKRTVTAMLEAEESPKFRPSEKACFWCPLAGECRAQKAWAVGSDFDPIPDEGNLTPDEMGDLLDREKAITAFYKNLRVKAEAALASGQSIPGWKRVLSTEHKAWIDAEAAEAALITEINDAHAPAKLRTPTQIIKDHPDLDFSDLWEVRDGVPTLAKESDTRPALETEFSAVDDDSAEA